MSNGTIIQLFKTSQKRQADFLPQASSVLHFCLFSTAQDRGESPRKVIHHDTYNVVRKAKGRGLRPALNDDIISALLKQKENSSLEREKGRGRERAQGD